MTVNRVHSTAGEAAVGPTRLAVLGLSGSGKSTIAGLIRASFERRGLTVATVKLAEPLYRLQHEVYAVAAMGLRPGAQDQFLLEELARQLRRIAPRALAEDFLGRLLQADADVVLNDDLRDPWVDFPVLRDAGFRMIRVVVDEETRRQRLSERADPSVVLDSESTANIDRIPADAVIHNTGAVSELAAAVEKTLGELL